MERDAEALAGGLGGAVPIERDTLHQQVYERLKHAILAGGIVPRIADRLAVSGFADRFTAKGRFETNMAAIPVKRITHPQPGLYGAAAAFAMHHAR